MGRAAEKVKEAGKNISRDVKMGFDPSSRDADYYARTAKTIARTQGSDAAQRYADQMTKKGGIAGQGIASLKGNALSQAAAQRDKEIARRAADSDDRQRRRAEAAASTTTPAADDMSDQYAENLRRYEEYMKSQQQPQQPAITPEMRQAALQTFESQQGAGQIPYYMAAARNQYNPNMSPAFQYAAQNYDVLGGSQRLAPRPMEMMSVAERRQINDMAQAMADQQAQQQAQQMDYQRGMDMVLRGGGKGGGATMPQTGGGMPRPPLPFAYGGGQQSPFASMLASRFGGFGG